MLNMYDILREDEENKKEQPVDPNQEKYDFEDILIDIDRDTKLTKFNTSDGSFVESAVSSSSREKGSLRFLLEIYLKEGQQISDSVFLETFKHLYNGCVRHGIHKFSDETFGNQVFMLSSIEIKSGTSRLTDGQFNMNLREIISREVLDRIEHQFRLVDLFGSNAYKESLSLTDLSKEKDTTPSYDNLNSRVKSEVENLLLLAPGVLPKFPENFEQERQRLIKRGKAIYLALSKGTFEGKPYKLQPVRFIYLYSVDRWEEASDMVDKETNTIRPNFDVTCFGDIDTYDGKSARDLSIENWEFYYKLKQHVQKTFKKVGASFT